ncbi:guanine nucleotide-binding protein subunit beta-like protein 1 isoform X2 [Dunckerocampus dactyliophorus]|uniref:guanine nucleotide-binding protein subunit beta-like protein 1 isoform X2 n=1 Tax=Dunckerocampus dactyliophorus TaxID=161453 RepID=UPI00240653AF|nr:guanine nucleotide-binding protein subunit beta-like protein 1 isoform X2 [Dunckerocampus dactyliophorus]
MSRPAPCPIYTLRGAGGPINTLHFSCHGGDTPLLFSGSGKGAIHMWNLSIRRAERIVEGHSGSSVIWVNTLSSTDTLISQGRDMRVCLWDLGRGRSELVDSLSTGSVGFCQCSLLETGSRTCLLAFAGQQTEEPHSGGPILLAGYEDGSLLLWDITQRSKLSQTKVHHEPVMCLTFDPEVLRGISGSSEKQLSSWILDGQNNLQLQDCVTLTNPGVSQLCIRGDGKLLASAGWDHRVRIFGWKNLRPLAVLQHHNDMVLSVAFSDHKDPRQRLLAAGSKDQRISLWSIYNQGPDTNS